jgi:voltage-dependent calcium channel N type alpha-1B
MEFVLKTVALGFVMHEHSYLRDAWNRLDFLVVCISVITIVTELGWYKVDDMSVAQGMRGALSTALAIHFGCYTGVLGTH